MDIVYFYLVYLRNKKDPEKIEVHGIPFSTREEAERYKSKADKHFGKRLYFSKIRRTDLSKSKDGLWIS